MLQRFILATVMSTCLVAFSTLSACGFKNDLYIPQSESAQNNPSENAELSLTSNQSQH